MITVTVRGQEAAIRRLDAINPSVRRLLSVRMIRLLIRMQSWVKTTKLSGDPLNRRTGALSRSIQYDVTDTSAGVVGRLYAGPNVPYAVVHEYGGTFTVPAHRRIIRQVFGRPIDPVEVSVRAYQATFPERSFLRPALREFSAEFASMVARAIRDAAAGDGATGQAT